MRRLRMENVDIEDIDPPKMAILSLKFAPTDINIGDTDWVCGHCDEILLRWASDRANESVVFRCPHCFRFSRFRQVQ